MGERVNQSKADGPLQGVSGGRASTGTADTGQRLIFSGYSVDGFPEALPCWRTSQSMGRNIVSTTSVFASLNRCSRLSSPLPMPGRSVLFAVERGVYAAGTTNPRAFARCSYAPRDIGWSTSLVLKVRVEPKLHRRECQAVLSL